MWRAPTRVCAQIDAKMRAQEADSDSRHDEERGHLYKPHDGQEGDRDRCVVIFWDPSRSSRPAPLHSSPHTACEAHCKRTEDQFGSNCLSFFFVHTSRVLAEKEEEMAKVPQEVFRHLLSTAMVKHVAGPWRSWRNETEVFVIFVQFSLHVTSAEFGVEWREGLRRAEWRGGFVALVSLADSEPRKSVQKVGQLLP